MSGRHVCVRDYTDRALRRRHQRSEGIASVPPKVLEPVRRQGRVDRSARDRSMAEPSLDCPGVVALMGESVATSVAKHVRMRLELEAGWRQHARSSGRSRPLRTVIPARSGSLISSATSGPFILGMTVTIREGRSMTFSNTATPSPNMSKPSNFSRTTVVSRKYNPRSLGHDQNGKSEPHATKLVDLCDVSARCSTVATVSTILSCGSADRAALEDGTGFFMCSGRSQASVRSAMVLTHSRFSLRVRMKRSATPLPSGCGTSSCSSSTPLAKK
jgi:hypothetical protein